MYRMIVMEPLGLTVVLRPVHAGVSVGIRISGIAGFIAGFRP